MAIDLIPDDYRKRREGLALLRRIGIGMASLLIAVILARGVLWGLHNHEQQKNQHLMAGEKAREQKYNEIQALEQRRNVLNSALSKRAQMIASPNISEMLHGLDDSFSAHIGLTDLVYTREGGERKNNTSAAQPNPLAAANNTSGKPPVGFLELRGSARNYAAFYQFVEKFSTRPAIVQIQVIETSRDTKSADDFVNFVAEAQVANAVAKAKP